MKKNTFGGRFFIALAFLFLYAPILVLVIFSFNATSSTAVWAGFTLDWYRELFQNELILGALWTTLAVSAIAAVVSTVIGTAAAIGFRNLKRRFRGVCMTVNNIPLTNADIITGVSMMLLFLLAVDAWNGPLRALLGEGDGARGVDAAPEDLGATASLRERAAQIGALARRVQTVVAVTGEVGIIANTRIVASNRVPQDAEKKNYLCPLVQLEAEDDEDGDGLPALTVYLKRSANVETQRLARSRVTEITADQFYAAALSNEAKVVLAKFKA